mmetsp:Transcript_17863/g.30181  ORF Transcript_17863/g.30181 Transcript_17863/m.30181 type:complete len:284 (-) Transcript_17863:902-1753(-)
MIQRTRTSLKTLTLRQRNLMRRMTLTLPISIRWSLMRRISTTMAMVVAVVTVLCAVCRMEVRYYQIKVKGRAYFQITLLLNILSFSFDASGNSREWDGNCGHLGESNCGSVSNRKCTTNDEGKCVPVGSPVQAPPHHSPPSPPNGLTSTNIQRGQSVDIDCGTSGACCVEGNFKSEINRGVQQIDLRGSSSCAIALTSATLRNCQSRPCIATCRGKCEVKVQARGRRGPSPSPTPRKSRGNSSGGSSVCDGGQASNCGSHSTDEIHCTWTDNGCVARDGIDMV